MQAIITKTIPWTTHKPTRIKAACSRGYIIVSDDSSLESANQEVAKTLIQKFIAEDEQDGVTKSKWRGHYATGQLPDMTYVHVPVVNVGFGCNQFSV